MESQRPIFINLSHELYRSLKMAAIEADSTMTQLVRQAIQLYLADKSNPKKKEQSA
jgi:metal-responsive CopG/Arc/MetJ family transcriptional regulator